MAPRYQQGMVLADQAPSAATADYRRQRALAEQLMAMGATGAPVYTPMQGLAQLGTTLVGAYAGRKADEALAQSREADRQTKAALLASALRAGTTQAPRSETFQDGTTINWEGRKGNPEEMAAILAGNPLTAETGLSLQLQNLDMERENQRYAREIEDQRRAAEEQRNFLMNQSRATQEFQARENQLTRAAQAANRSPDQFTAMLNAAGITVGSPEAREFIDANFGPKSTAAPQQVTEATKAIGTGFAGGSPTNALYDPGNMIDRNQARIDAQEAAKAQANARAAAAAAGGDLGQARQMMAANEAAYTGPLAGINQYGNQFLGMLGNKEAAARASAYETLESGAADMARAERTPGEGAVSDFDAKQFLKIVPGPNRSEAFNVRALQAREQAFVTAQERAQFLEEFRRRNGNMVGAEDSWLRYAKDNPILNPDMDLEKPETMLNPRRKSWKVYFGLEQVPVADATPDGATPGQLTPEEEQERTRLLAQLGGGRS